METIEYRDVVDRTGWSAGPWADEPDKVQWRDDETGLPCLIVRGPMGALCGYVGVAAGHPWYGRNYSDVDVGVHGGLTFSAPSQEPSASGLSICHVPGEGEPDDVWWLGFDCGHYRDLSPAMPGIGGVYRNISYVRAECRHLARQAAAV